MARIRSGNIVAWDRERGNSAFIRKHPQMSASEIAHTIGCSVNLVYQVRKNLGNGKTGHVDGTMVKKTYILENYRKMTAKELSVAASCSVGHVRSVLKAAGLRCKLAPLGRPYNKPETKGSLPKNHSFAGPITEEGLFLMLGIEYGSLEHDIWVAGNRVGGDKNLAKIFQNVQRKMESLKDVVSKVA